MNDRTKFEWWQPFGPLASRRLLLKWGVRLTTTAHITTHNRAVHKTGGEQIGWSLSLAGLVGVNENVFHFSSVYILPFRTFRGGIQELAPWFPRLLVRQWACLSALLYKSLQRLAVRLWCCKRIARIMSFQKCSRIFFCWNRSRLLA